MSRAVRVTLDFELRVQWEDDWSVGSHFREYGAAYQDENGEPVEPDTCEQATVWGPQGECLASLGCIDSASDEYRAEIESDLLAEAGAELGRLYPAHADYPHHPGYLHDCPACDAACHCSPGNTECVFDGEHNGTAAP